MSPLEIAQVAYQAGFRGLDLVYATAIALAESGGGDPSAHCLNCAGVSEDSRGLWQINVNAHPQWANDNLYDPATNAKHAFELYQGRGNTFGDWSTWTQGQYRTYIGAATAAASTVIQSILGGPVGAAVSTSQGGQAGNVVDTGAAAAASAAKQVGIDLPPISIPGVSDIPGAIQAAGQGAVNAVQQITQPIVSGIANLNSLVKFIGDPKSATALLMIWSGLGITLLGIILFALSLIGPGTVRRAAAIA